MMQTLLDWDKELFLAINGIRNITLDILMPILSLTWLLWVLGAIVFGVWTFRALRCRNKRKRLLVVLFGVALILGTAGVMDIVCNAVKHHTGRVRPYQALPFAHYQTRSGWRQNAETFTPAKHRSDSFFSGHAAHSMAVAVTAATLFPPMAPVIYAMPLAVGYSRIYLGKHYPSDILAGWLAGMGIALLARRLTRKCRKNLTAEALAGAPADVPTDAPGGGNQLPPTAVCASRAKSAAHSTR